MQLATFKYNNNNDKSSTVFEWWIHDDDDIITLIVFQGVFSRGGDGICHYKIIFDTFFIFFPETQGAAKHFKISHAYFTLWWSLWTHLYPILSPKNICIVKNALIPVNFSILTRFLAWIQLYFYCIKERFELNAFKVSLKISSNNYVPCYKTICETF